jgi:hypothetical protein
VESLYIETDEDGSASVSTGQVVPDGVDPARDDLSVYPFIYWAIDPDQPDLSSRAIENLNNYMKNGGVLFIDTRDVSTQNRGKSRLRRAEQNGLKIPVLEQILPCSDINKECHSLSKSFYLLSDFPGRHEGSGLWAEKTSLYRSEGVSNLIIGGNEWAAAWAIDAEGEPVYPVIGSEPKQREYAYRVGVNAVIYALTGNYKSDQAHLPHLMKRLESEP